MNENDPRWTGNALRAKGALNLAETHPTYPQPERNPNISQDLSDGRVKYVHSETGDKLVGVPSSSHPDHPRIIEYYFEDAEGREQAGYRIQEIPGYPEHVAFDPLRLIQTYHFLGADKTVIAARYNVERLAEFLASEPAREKWPERRFLLIDAPLEEGEELR
ncbi:MAG: hypothetical protein WBA68_03755 [Alteraurantiacibacter sp.]